MSSLYPEWRLLAQLGDVNPFEYGGAYVLQDPTGQNVEMLEILEVPEEEEFDEEPPEDEDEGWDRDAHSNGFTVYRFNLDRCTFVNGVLSDNPFHPEHPAWFARPADERAPNAKSGLQMVASCVGKDVDVLVEELCSEDPVSRAQAYQDLFSYHGSDNFDSDPLELNCVLLFL